MADSLTDSYSSVQSALEQLSGNIPNSSEFVKSVPTSALSKINSLGLDDNGRVEFTSESGKSVVTASLHDLQSTPSSGGSSGSSVQALAYYNTYIGNNTLVLDETPVILHLVSRSSGGAGNADKIVYPGGMTFKYPPYITGVGGDLSQDDWNSGKTLGVANISITAQTNYGFSYNHVSGWPGWNYEVISFLIVGVLNKSS